MRAYLLVVAAAACADARAPQSFRVDTGGDAAHGKERLRARGCAACHEVPDIDEPGGHVGPSLDGFARRSFIAGRVPNTPAYLVRWLRDPHEIDPHTAMPELGLTEEEARDVAAYLYTLD